MTHTAIGVDVGGTFTDVVVTTPAGTVIAKAPTTPADQSLGALEGIARAAAALGMETGTLLAAAGRIVHGTTVATNALLEGTGARVGLLTTAGHRDVVAMREGLKPERYNLRMPPPVPPVPRALRLGVEERTGPDGAVLAPLAPASLDAALATLAGANVGAVAVCFLHAWANPAHEHEAAEAARRRLPGAWVTCSSDVLPVIGEYARFMTTIANAAVGPVVSAHLARLERRLRAAGFGGRLDIILSHGGVARVAEASRLAVATVLSGPAGGAAAAEALARAGAGGNLIGFDMGGTSTDITLVTAGAAARAGERDVGPARIALPSLDIVTLGAGGGSIARVNAAGLLQVGPESAGAVPGPACYGRGGTAATVTDANLVLGRLGEDFAGGRLDRAAAEAALARLGAPLGLDALQAAAGVVRVVDSRMADGIRVATVRRGIDPRGYALLAFGGAAGLHVSAVARDLGIGRATLPLAASVLSAWGMLASAPRAEVEQSLGVDLPRLDPGALAAAWARLEETAAARLGQPVEAFVRSASMRAGEQVFEIQVPLTPFDWSAEGLAGRLAEAFHRQHELLYAWAPRGQDCVLTTLRVAATGALPPPPAPPSAAAPRPPGRRRVWLDGWQELEVHTLDGLAPGAAVEGPALLESATTTVLLGAADRARMDARGWLEVSTGA